MTVTASDTGTGVAAVQLQLDGLPYGTADTASPYTFTLNTASFANGSHSLTATAWDQANNSATSSKLPVTFSNSSSGNPTQSGAWSGTVPLPIVTVHSVLLPTGKILFWVVKPTGSTPSSGILPSTPLSRFRHPLTCSVAGTNKWRTDGSWSSVATSPATLGSLGQYL